MEDQILLFKKFNIGHFKSAISTLNPVIKKYLDIQVNGSAVTGAYVFDEVQNTYDFNLCKRENLLELYNLVASICSYDNSKYSKAYSKLIGDNNLNEPINAEIML